MRKQWIVQLCQTQASVIRKLCLQNPLIHQTWKQHGADSFHGAATSSLKISYRKFLRYRGHSSGKGKKKRLLWPAEVVGNKEAQNPQVRRGRIHPTKQLSKLLCSPWETFSHFQKSPWKVTGFRDAVHNSSRANNSSSNSTAHRECFSCSVFSALMFRHRTAPRILWHNFGHLHLWHWASSAAAPGEEKDGWRQEKAKWTWNSSKHSHLTGGRSLLFKWAFVILHRKFQQMDYFLPVPKMHEVKIE